MGNAGLRRAHPRCAHARAAIPSLPSYTQPPRAAERGRKVRPTPVAVRAEAAGIRGDDPGKSETRRRRRRRSPALDADLAVTVAYGLDPAAGGAGGASARLHQRPRLAAAALAWRGADPAGDHGGRYRDRGHHHAHGRGARHGPHADGRAGADRGRDHGRRAARRARRTLRPARGGGDRCDSPLARWPRRRSRRTAPLTRRSSKSTKPPSTGARPRRTLSARCARSRRDPAPGSTTTGERIKVLAAEEAAAGIPGAPPGTVVDDVADRRLR